MERKTYQELMNIYREMYQLDEKSNEQNAGKIGSGGLRKAVGNRPVQGAKGSPHGKLYGIGKDKRYVNEPKKDDARAKKQSDQAKADRKAAAMDRRRDGTAKPTKLDKLLDKIQDN